MSVEAITWALKSDVKQSSAKFVLVVLANCASAETMEAYPSIAHLSEATSQDRKTVIANVKRLIDLGLIADTGKRKGATGQVVLYKLNSTKNGTVKESQKRNSSENGTVPDFPDNSTVFPLKQYRFSLETVPKTGHVNVSEPSIEPPVNIKPKKPPFDARKFLSEQGCSDDVIEDWLTLRKKKGASNTKTAIDPIVKESHKAGMTVEQALIECCSRNWQGFKADWLTPKQNAPNGYKSIHDQRAETIAVLTGRKSNVHGTERDITGESQRVS